MSDSIDLFEPEGFIPNDLRPHIITLKSTKTTRSNKKAIYVYQNANKRVATEPVDHKNAKSQ